ncbi:hypothetical protein [Flavobacterium gyeonganense]|uniref:Uncharacterized protein n=1 Tax=Flavobacterium gyeonganense TaxID=1310418 RepID=A0ABV5H653_9FLAO|nr:hypothetical protein [Flavobacterium gyeonganense]
MIDNLKYTTKLFSSAAFSFLKINIIGQLLICALSVATLLIFLFQSADGPGAPGGLTIIPITMTLFFERPIGFTLTTLSIFVLPFILFSFGNKYIISKTTNKLLSDKGEKLLFPIIEKVLGKIKTNQPGLLKKGADNTKLKLRLIQEIKDSKESNKWLKKIIIYGFKKINLDDVDFTNENISFVDIIKEKTISGLKDVSNPSRNFFWIIIGIQISLLILVSTRMI